MGLAARPKNSSRMSSSPRPSLSKVPAHCPHTSIFRVPNPPNSPSPPPRLLPSASTSLPSKVLRFGAGREKLRQTSKQKPSRNPSFPQWRTWETPARTPPRRGPKLYRPPQPTRALPLLEPCARGVPRGGEMGGWGTTALTFFFSFTAVLGRGRGLVWLGPVVMRAHAFGVLVVVLGRGRWNAGLAFAFIVGCCSAAAARPSHGAHGGRAFSIDGSRRRDTMCCLMAWWRRNTLVEWASFRAKAEINAKSRRE